jgi:outer membrane protein assembly factor BamB
MYRRAAALAAVLFLWLLLGPVVPILLVVALAVPRSRWWISDRFRPERPWRATGIAAGVVVVLSLLAVVIPDGWLPIPPGPGLLVAPSYVGREAIPRPINAIDLPQHPHLARNGASSMHNDAYASDSYSWPGPIGDAPDVDSAWFGIEECATLAFDSRDRLVALCGDLEGPTLRVLDPDNMRPLATKDLPDRVDVNGKAPWENLCGGSYFYLDEADRAVVATTDRRILAIGTADADGNPDLTTEETYDVSSVVPDDDCLIALMPDWDGRIWFETQNGVVGAVDPDTGKVRSLDLEEEIANSFSVDEDGGVYIVSTEAMYRFDADRTGRPEVTWRAQYDRGSEQKPGQLSQGSGTTPTLLTNGLVAITDNADPRMHVLFLRRDNGDEVCSAPVFEEDASATDNSLVAVGNGVVVENNHGYSSPLSTILGFGTSPGFARVDVVDGECEVVWTSDLVAPTSVAKASLATGLLYAYTKRPTLWGVSAWYLSAIDLRTGRHVFSIRTGTGTLMNNHYAAVTLGPDGSAYIATLAGMVRVKDAERD